MTSIDYDATYFKYLLSSLINGEPTSKMLKILKTDLRVNGSSVDTDLRGGDHGYLGLILANQEYLRINPTPTQLETPTWSGVLVIDLTATAVEAVREKGRTQKNHTYI